MEKEGNFILVYLVSLYFLHAFIFVEVLCFSERLGYFLNT